MRSLFTWLFRALLGALLAVPLGLLGLAWVCTDESPSVSQAPQFTPAHIERARRLVERNDPRRMRNGMLRTITVTQDDLDLALNYLARRQLKASTRLTLQDGAARLEASLPLPTNPFGHYLNVDLLLRDTGARPRLEVLRIGRLAVPQLLSDRLLRAGLDWLQHSPDYGPATDSIQRVQVSSQMLSVVYVWNDVLPEQLKAAMLQPGEQARLLVYQTRLVALTAAPAATAASKAAAPARVMPLHTLLQPMLELAAQQAAAAGDGAADTAAQRLALEHRAALVALAFYINGKGLSAVVPAAAQWPVPAPRSVTLGGRGDFAQHFSVSAALAATAGSPLSDAVGLYKEVDDSRGGSGFSFNDIAADRSGSRFGELATGAETAQARLRRRLGPGLTDQDLLPQVKDLPEFMQEAEFKRRYGAIGSPGYKRMQAEIEQRIAALPLYR